MSIGKIVMNLMRLNGLRTAICALAVLALAPATIAQRPHSTAADSPIWNDAAKEQVLNRMSRLIQNQAYVPGVDFSKWDAMLAKIRPDAVKAKTEDEFAAIVDTGLRDAFKISHIVLLPPSAVNQRNNPQMVGIGIRIAETTPEGLVVANTIPGAPAEKAGIEPGDVIMEADGHKADRQYITGPEGTYVTLKVKKSDGTVKTIKVIRAQFRTVQKEELSWVDKDTAAIRIFTFDLSYDRDNVENLMKQAGKAKNLLVDLRGNGGGAVGNMMHFLSLIMDRGTEIGTFINKKDVDDFVSQTKGDRNDLAGIARNSMTKLRVGTNPIPVFKGHIAVLVNPGSGSASEITAEALKELLNSPIVGKKSAGAVLVSVMGELPHHFNLQFPISDYVSNKGVRLEANGIVPDAEAEDVPFIKNGQVDPAYVTAETLLNKIAQSHG